MASHLGGTRNPMVLAWPARIRDRGGLRQQFGHVNDIVPTILEAAGIAAPASVNGVAQRPMDGTSLAYTFADAKAAERHTTQYFEIYGNRAIYHDGWMASAFRGRVPWNVISAPRSTDFAADRWELYDLRTDFSQGRDLAAREPGKLRELQQLFDTQAAANNVVLHNPSRENTRFPDLAAGRTHFEYRPGTIGIAEKEAPNTKTRSHVIEAHIRVPEGGAHGVLATLGGRSAGWSLYLDDDGVPVYRLRIFDAEEITLRGTAPLEAGEHVLRYEFATTGAGPVPGGTDAAQRGRQGSSECDAKAHRHDVLDRRDLRYRPGYRLIAGRLSCTLPVHGRDPGGEHRAAIASRPACTLVLEVAGLAAPRRAARRLSRSAAGLRAHQLTLARRESWRPLFPRP